MELNFGSIALIVLGLIILFGILNVLTQKKDPKQKSTKKKKDSYSTSDLISDIVWFWH